MSLLKNACPHLERLPVYQPGKPIEQVAREHGIPLDSICKLASNENLLGASPHALEAAEEALAQVHYYPDGGCTELRDALARRYRIKPEQFVFGNGSNDLIELLAHAFITPGSEAVMGEYSFPVYQIVTMLMGGTPVRVPMPDFRHDLDAMVAAITDKTRIIFLPSTNNPTGTSNSAEDVERFIGRLPDHVILLFDEAYAEYTHGCPDLRSQIAEGRPVFCTRTFSKLYGLAGLRIGYGYGSVELVELLNRLRQPFNVNSVAQAAAIAALDDVRFIKRTRETNAMGLMQLYSGFEKLGLKFVASDANFVLVEVPRAEEAFVFLQKRGLIVRPLPAMGNFLRVTVGIELQNHALLRGLNAWLDVCEGKHGGRSGVPGAV